jgi:hypothetical protein
MAMVMAMAIATVDLQSGSRFEGPRAPGKGSSPLPLGIPTKFEP